MKFIVIILVLFSSLSTQSQSLDSLNTKSINSGAFISANSGPFFYTAICYKLKKHSFLLGPQFFLELYHKLPIQVPRTGASPKNWIQDVGVFGAYQYNLFASKKLKVFLQIDGHYMRTFTIFQNKVKNMYEINSGFGFNYNFNNRFYLYQSTAFGLFFNDIYTTRTDIGGNITGYLGIGYNFSK